MHRSIRTSRRGVWRSLAALIAPIALYGCIYDHPCEENQVEQKSDFQGCVCVEGAVPNAEKNGCVMCGANEEVKSGVCECKPGFARASADAPCAASSQGSACSASTPCNGSEFPYCSPAGQCTTSGCTTNADCSAGGYLCDKTMSTSYCRAPVGLTMSCTSSADCTGDAKLCAMGQCVVSGCATTGCFGSLTCCDFAAFGVGIPDICVPPGQITNGKCPGGADPVGP